MQVNITKRIDTPDGKRYCPVVIGPNGRIKPDWVMIDDRPEKHPEEVAKLRKYLDDAEAMLASVGIIGRKPLQQIRRYRYSLSCPRPFRWSARVFCLYR